MTIELSVSLLHLDEGSHYQQLNRTVLALTMQFACSVRFIICGTALKFSAIIHYEWASLFYLKKNQNIFGICHLNDLLSFTLKTGSGHQS